MTGVAGDHFRVRKTYLVLALGIVALGVVHMLTTFLAFDELNSSALWFFSGGIAMVLTGALNVLNRSYGRVAPGLRLVCIGANVVLLSFAAIAGVVGRSGVTAYVIILGLVGSTTLLSIIRKSNSDRAA